MPPENPPMPDEIEQLAQYYISNVAQLFTSQDITQNNYQITTPTQGLRNQIDDLTADIKLLINREVTKAVEDVTAKNKQARLEELENERADIRTASPGGERGTVVLQADGQGLETTPTIDNIS